MICGDLPTDYISRSELDHPRAVVRAIATRWLDYATYLHMGQAHPEITIGNGTPDAGLADLLTFVVKSKSKPTDFAAAFDSHCRWS
jgi:hypothetical protein